jgi:hypothetical protein
LCVGIEEYVSGIELKWFILMQHLVDGGDTVIPETLFKYLQTTPYGVIK